MPKKWGLRTYGDPILRKKSKPIDEITDEIKQLAHYMVEFFDNHRGIGLSAVQIGVPIRLFVLRDYVEDEDGKLIISDTPKFYINPKIVWKSEETYSDTEGCLSIPGFTAGPVERPCKVKIEALDLDGNLFTEEREGLNARVTFHENDHLNGVLFIDRLPPQERKAIEPELRALKKKFSQ